MSRPKPEDVDGDYDHSRKPVKDIMREYYEDSLSPAQKRKIHFNRVNRSGKGDMEPVKPPKATKPGSSRDLNTGRFANVALSSFKRRKGGKVVEE